MAEFKKGTRIPTVTGNEIEIVEKLGEGGQGVVYKVKHDGKLRALKWYFPGKLQDEAAFIKNLENNINNGAPTKAFLWPLELTEYVDGSFGYVMELRPQEYKDFSRFLLAREHIKSIDALINAALCITNAFRALHAKGYSYQDLNDGNFFINPNTGDVLICDNDNVAPYGKSLGIAGKCRYMAPEVVTHKKLPDVFTDRFSLGVVLYMLLCLNHPLEGKRTLCPCMTEELEYKFFGTDPVFVYDPDNDTNRPVPGVHINELMLWKFYPKFIKDMFCKAFSRKAMVGEQNEIAQTRPIDDDWEDLFIALKNASVKCNSCDETTMIDLDGGNRPICVNCGKPVKRLPILTIKNNRVNHRVILAKGKTLHPCHIVKGSRDYEEDLAEVIVSKMDANIIGLKNLSENTWNITNANGETRQFEKGKTIQLLPGLKIAFNNDMIGEVN